MHAVSSLDITSVNPYLITNQYTRVLNLINIFRIFHGCFKSLAHLVKYFGWTWVGAIRSNNDYGNNGMATFTETAQQLGICLEYSVSFFRTDPYVKIQKIIEIIKASTSKVIVAFLARADFNVLLPEFSYHNLSGYQWVGSESWIFDSQTAEMDMHHILDGAIGVSIPKAHVTGLREFILNKKPINPSNNDLFTEFWETTFSCKFKELKSSADIQRECTGHEDMTGVQINFIDMSLMPIFNNVYKGVYAVAHALHNILSCNKTLLLEAKVSPSRVRIIMVRYNISLIFRAEYNNLSYPGLYVFKTSLQLNRIGPSIEPCGTP
uniref:Receptor ligand binding region domain-containing protein n=1 Tax=Neolamprologus brichardi TaxID=32507 RepID=A0A3Q4G106_NEOBR